MAEGGGEKSHAPTAKRLEDARRKGEVAVAAEMRHAVMLGAMWVAGTGLAATTLASLAQFATGLWTGAGTMRLESGSGQPFAAWLLRELAGRVGPLLGLFFVAALLIGAAQGRPTFSLSRLSLKWSRLNPAAGLGRLLGTRALIEFGKTLLKCGGVGLICWWTLRPFIGGLPSTVGLEPLGIAQLAGTLTFTLLKSVLLLVSAIAAADFLYQHRAFLQKMRMTLQELKDEHRESDGDPQVKARQRRIGAERVRRRMMAAVPSATVVVTNPTHFAVALKYEHGEMRAPMVVAKGVDLLALRIREVAAEHKVPVLESPPLARALYASAEIDRPIPVEHYAAVAEIISYVLQLAKARRGGLTAPAWPVRPGS